VRVHIIDEGKMPPAPVYGDAHSSSFADASDCHRSSALLVFLAVVAGCVLSLGEEDQLLTYLPRTMNI
jgi:hypothetical protein